MNEQVTGKWIAKTKLRLRDKATEVLRQAQKEGWGARQLADEWWSQVYEDPDYEKLPRWARATVEGHIDGLRSALYQLILEIDIGKNKLYWPNGRLYDTLHKRKD